MILRSAEKVTRQCACVHISSSSAELEPSSYVYHCHETLNKALNDEEIVYFGTILMIKTCFGTKLMIKT